MNTFFRFLSRVSFIILSGCASSSQVGTPGFQKSYPWNWTPYTNAPWIYQVSFNDFIDLEPFYLNDQIRKNKQRQDAQVGYPINALTDSLRKQY